MQTDPSASPDKTTRQAWALVVGAAREAYVPEPDFDPWEGYPEGGEDPGDVEPAEPYLA